MIEMALYAKWKGAIRYEVLELSCGERACEACQRRGGITLQ